jgi:hypothetical protein
MRCLALLVLALAVAAPASAAPGKLTTSERRWVADLDAFGNDLLANVQLASSGGSDVATARHALRDLSDLYATLVAYTYFDGCTTTLRNVGPPSVRLAPAARKLQGACRGFERAADLYEQAVRRSDARALVAASRASLTAYASFAATRAAIDGLAR